MPCYLADNVDRQRGKGVFGGSIRGLRRLNAVGYGREATGLVLNLVFNRLFVLANMPIQRFGSMLVSKGEFDGYLRLLQDAHLDANLDGVMCRNLISIDWRGYVYDCDFNQMLDLPLARGANERVHLSDLLDAGLADNPVRVAGHCYGCTAGQGSSCGGALKEAAE
jgi:radical SAM/Cys-rich protein